MIKKLVRIALFAMLAHGGSVLAAEDYVLWFMVDDTAQIEGKNILDYNNSNTPGINAARLHVTGDGVDGYLNLAYLSEDGKTLEYFSAEDGAPAIVAQLALMDEDSCSTGWTLGSLLKSGTGTDSFTQFRFAVELGNVDFETAAWTAIASSEAAYSDIASHITAVEDSIVASQVTAWTPTAFTPVPEPTGGLLVLVGAAILSLKRKRVA